MAHGAKIEMTRSELHELAVRRRGDPDVLTLLLEIKRLHGVLVEAHRVAGGLPRYEEDLNASAGVMRLLELLQAEPAIDDPAPANYGGPDREGPAENEGDRAAKRAAREKRG